MAFDAYNCSLALLRALQPLVRRLAGHDPKLADQLRRAASSTVLNIAEANRRVDRDRKNRFRIALGSAAESTACLDVAVILGYLVDADIAEHLKLADRVRAMTYKLATK